MAERDYKKEYENRRKRTRRVHGEIEREKAERLNRLIEARGLTFNKWLNEQVNKEIDKAAEL